MILSIKNISLYYGKAMALDNVSIEIEDGSVVTMIGANGAGKSTVLRALSDKFRGNLVFRQEDRWHKSD
jgi:branched-chain amino acid transport system ATP-binding protein